MHQLLMADSLATGITSAVSTDRRSLWRLATVEIQSVCHFLDRSTVLALGRCSRELMRLVRQPFTWQHHVWSISCAQLEFTDLRLSLTLNLPLHMRCESAVMSGLNHVASSTLVHRSAPVTVAASAAACAIRL
jgi:hypothetical protein